MFHRHVMEVVQVQPRAVLGQLVVRSVPTTFGEEMQQKL